MGFATAEVHENPKPGQSFEHVAWIRATDQIKLEDIIRRHVHVDAFILVYDDEASQAYADALQLKFRDAGAKAGTTELRLVGITTQTWTHKTKAVSALQHWLKRRKVWWNIGQGYLTEDYLLELGERTV